MNTAVKILREIKHLKTEVDPHKLGDSQAEVVFIGRSNVGKSSLINAICQRKNLARVSQVPGKTRTINIYEVLTGRWIVDLPGYGFAVGLKKEKDGLSKIIEEYFQSRHLNMVFVIVDAVVGPTNLDIAMINWLSENSFPLSIVVSKADKISSSKRDDKKNAIATQLSVDVSCVFLVSSRKNIGIADMQGIVAKLLQI